MIANQGVANTFVSSTLPPSKPTRKIIESVQGCYNAKSQTHKISKEKNVKRRRQSRHGCCNVKRRPEAPGDSRDHEHSRCLEAFN